MKHPIKYSALCIVAVGAALLIACAPSLAVTPLGSPPASANVPSATPLPAFSATGNATVVGTPQPSRVATVVVIGETPRVGTFGPAATASVTTAPTAMATLPPGVSPIRVKYQLIERFGDVFFCDPDLYPVAREVTDEEVAQRVAKLMQNAEEYQAILEHLGLGGVTQLTPAQQRLIDAERKRLDAIALERAGDRYQFAFQARNGGDRGHLIRGLISADGEITVISQERVVLRCPICLTGWTLIDTPIGEVPVKDLQVGMAVWTVTRAGARTPGVIVQTVRRALPAGSSIIDLRLSDGRSLSVSAGHPTFDGHPLGELNVGELYDGARVISVMPVPLEDDATYDILPSGETGAYWANEVLLGSTLATPNER